MKLGTEVIETLKDSKDIKQTFIALAHRIKLNEANWKKKYLISLVETAFFYKDDHFFDNLLDIQIFLKSEGITRFEIYVHELKDALNELEREGFLLKTHHGWKLSEHRKTELENATNEWLNLEQKVKEDWLNNISSKYPNIHQDEKNQLWAQLIEKFVSKIFLRHGAETSKLIFRQTIANEEDFLESCQNILEISIQELSPRLRDIARKEYPLFFDPDDSTCRQYLIGLLDTSLSQFAMSIPEESLQSIYNITSLELKLFLDTNFLFSSLDLGDHHLNESVREVLKLQQTISEISGGKIKIEFHYIAETLDEFKKAIDSSISRLNGAQVNKSIAKAVVKSKGLSGLDLAYFKKSAKSDISISPEEYYRPYRNSAERLLRGKGIEIYNHRDKSLLKDDIRYAQEIIDDIHDFDEWLKTRGVERQWETVERDIRLWHYIKNLRNHISTTFLTPLAATFFILTLDYRFLGFDRRKLKGTDENPFCLLPTQLLQMLSLFLPRTEDFEKAFIFSIKIPMAKTVYTEAETERVSLNILKAMAVYKDFSEDLAIGLLMDETLKAEAKGITDPEEVRKLIEDKLSKELEEERKKYQNLEKEKSTKLSEKDTQITHFKELTKQSELKIKELEKQTKDLQKFKTESEKEEREKLEYKKTATLIIKWASCVVLWIFLGIFLLKFWDKIPKTLQVVLISCIIWPLALPLGLKKTWKIFLAISAVLGFMRVMAWLLRIE